MRKLICLLAALLLVLPLTAGAEENLQSMIDGLPTVEDFQAMDSEGQLEAYNQVQAAYDAYMALGEEEKAAITGAEETFETLFAWFNAQVMPLEPEEPKRDPVSNLVSTALAVIPVVLVLRLFEKKKVR